MLTAENAHSAALLLPGLSRMKLAYFSAALLWLSPDIVRHAPLVPFHPASTSKPQPIGHCIGKWYSSNGFTSSRRDVKAIFRCCNDMVSIRPLCEMNWRVEWGRASARHLFMLFQLLPCLLHFLAKPSHCSIFDTAKSCKRASILFAFNMSVD